MTRCRVPHGGPLGVGGACVDLKYTGRGLGPAHLTDEEYGALPTPPTHPRDLPTLRPHPRTEHKQSPYLMCWLAKFKEIIAMKCLAQGQACTKHFTR